MTAPRSATARKPTPLFTAEQRKQIEAELMLPWGLVSVTLDGRRITLTVRRLKELTWVVSVHIDGTMESEWCRSGNEVGAKYWRPETRCAVSAKLLRAHQKAYGKRSTERVRKQATFTQHFPYFRSAKSFLAHVGKTCTQATELSIGPQPSQEVAHG